MTHEMRIVLVLIVFILAGGALRNAIPHHSATVDPPAVHIDESHSCAQRLLLGGTVDINSATREDFELLDGIGPVRAARIVHERLTNGPFASVADLQRVYGIGPRLVARNRHWLSAEKLATSASGRDET